VELRLYVPIAYARRDGGGPSHNCPARLSVVCAWKRGVLARLCLSLPLRKDCMTGAAPARIPLIAVQA